MKTMNMKWLQDSLEYGYVDDTKVVWRGKVKDLPKMWKVNDFLNAQKLIIEEGEDYINNLRHYKNLHQYVYLIDDQPINPIYFNSVIWQLFPLQMMMNSPRKEVIIYHAPTRENYHGRDDIDRHPIMVRRGNKQSDTCYVIAPMLWEGEEDE